MSYEYIYVVTRYGSNSTPGDLWTPISKVFVSRDAAYKHFQKVSPPMGLEDDDDFPVTRYAITSEEYDAKVAKKEDHIVIEINFNGGMKRPDGAVIVATRLVIE
jgi:hypothetical protein